MSARVVLGVAVAALAAGSAWADEKVQPMSKVSSGGSSSSGSEYSKVTPSNSSHSSSSSSPSRAQSARSASRRSSSERSEQASATRRGPETEAQRRHPRPGTGTGNGFDSGRYGYRGRGSRYAWGSPNYGYGYGYGRYGRYGYYYNPYDSWYSPYYYSGYYGYAPGYYGYSQGSYRRSRGYGYRDNGSLRLIVEPEKTRVYVDGYYAGLVDDFDGIFQRLNVQPGRHDITLRLEGYRTQHFKVYVPVDDTIKIHYDMVRGSGEATSEEFARHPEAEYGRVRDLNDEDRRDREARERGDDERWDRRDAGDRDRGPSGDTGSVRLSISPRDASVYVDGEFRGSGRDSDNLRLRPGRHRIEVVRPGYRTIEREIEVENGRSTTVEFDLERM